MKPDHRRALSIARALLDQPEDVRDAQLHELAGSDDRLVEHVQRLFHHLRDIKDDGGLTGGPGRTNEPPPDQLIGTRLGPFRVVELIGRGGMGVVYRGERDEADFHQDVALKLIRRGFDFDTVHARFLRERRILARLDHPNLARFIDGGVSDDGRPWFALEFVHGQRITRWCDDRRMTIPQRVHLFLAVCAAVQYAHSQLVVHRDLKPDNILVDERGTIRLLDFGIAQLLGDDEHGITVTRADAGYAITPEYAAPEQFTGTTVGVAADIYALGAVLYALVTGVPPIALDRSDLFHAAQQARDTTPQSPETAIMRVDANQATDGPPETHRLTARTTQAAAYRRMVRGDLSRILEKALAKEPDRRYASASALAEDLQRWLAGAPVHATGDTLRYRAGKFIRRNLPAVATAAVLTLALLATSVIAIRMALAERQQRELAHVELERSNAVRDYVMLMLRTVSDQTRNTPMTGREALQQGASTVRAKFEENPQAGIDTMMLLAELFTQIGDTEGAEPMLRQVVDWPDVSTQPDTLARARYQLAQIMQQRGQPSDAAALLDLAQAHWQRSSQRNAAILNESRALQAQLLRAAGRAHDAAVLLATAIQTRRDTLGLIDRELASAMAMQATALTEAGDFAAAYAAADQALELFRSLGLGRSVGGLAALNNRAVTATYLRRMDEAIADFQQVVDIHRELFGRNSNLAMAELNLGRILMGQGRFAEAIPLAEDALAISTTERGEFSAAAVFSRALLSEGLVGLGRHDEALEHAEIAVSVAADHHRDSSDQAYLTTLRTRAIARAAVGDIEGARADLDEAAIGLKALGAAGELSLTLLERLREQLFNTPLAP
jgi:serine/threonine protein kinase